MRKLLILSLVLLVLGAFQHDAFAIPTTNASNMGLAGAGGARMFGVQAQGYNPANLGLNANYPLSMNFPLSLGMILGNNSFSPDYIAETFVEGDTLTAEKKNAILDKLDVDDFRIYSNFSLPVFGVSVGSYAFNIDAVAHAQARMPADLFEMALTGPVVNEVYDLNNVEQEAIGYASFSFSGAKSFEPPHPMLRELSVGATFKYLRGFAANVLDEHEGQLSVTHEIIDAYGHFKNLTSTSGDGVGIDLGAAAIIEPLDMYVGLNLGNLVGSINWTEAEANEFYFERSDGIHIDSMTNSDYWEDFFHQSDSTYDAEDFSTPLPRYMLLAVSKGFMANDIIGYFSYYQGLNESSGHTMAPKVSFGAELNYVDFMPLRFGIGFGGNEKYEFGAGIGFETPVWRIDIGGSWHRGLATGAQGFSFGMTNYFGNLTAP